MNLARPMLVDEAERRFLAEPLPIEWDMKWGEARSVIARVIRDGDDVTLTEWLANDVDGDAATPVVPGGTPIDIGNWRVGAEARFYDAPNGLSPLPWVSDRVEDDEALAIQAVDASEGIVRLDLPASLPPVNPALGAAVVPVAQVSVEIVDDGSPANRWILQYMARWRHGSIVSTDVIPEGHGTDPMPSADLPRYILWSPDRQIDSTDIAGLAGIESDILPVPVVPAELMDRQLYIVIVYPQAAGNPVKLTLEGTSTNQLNSFQPIEGDPSLMRRLPGMQMDTQFKYRASLRPLSPRLAGRRLHLEFPPNPE